MTSGTPIYPSAWKTHSQKLNFRFGEFYEVRLVSITASPKPVTPLRIPAEKAANAATSREALSMS